MPAFVDTNIMPEGLVAKWPNEHITPLSTIMRAFNELVDESGRVEMDGKSQGGKWGGEERMCGRVCD